MRAHFDGVHTPGGRTHGRPAHRNWAHPRLRRDAALIGGAIVGVIAQPPRPGGQVIRRFMDRGQVVPPCGQHLHAHGHAIRSADQMQTPSKELLPFRRALPAEFAPAHHPTAPGAHTTADWQGEVHLQETFSDVVKTDKTGLSKTAHTRWMISAFANFLPGSTIFRLA